MSSPLLRPLGFGEILDGAFSLYRRHFAVFFGTALLAMLPMSLVSGLWLRTVQNVSPDAPDVAAVLGSLLLFFFVSLAGWMVLSAALTHQTARAVTGSASTVGDGYSLAFRRLVPLAAALLLMGAAIALAAFVVAVAGAVAIALVGVVAATAGAMSPGAIPAIMAGAGAVVVTGAVLLSMLAIMAMFFAVVPAVVLEGSGPAAALRRSWRLSQGARLRIIGVLAVAWLIVTLPTIGLTFAFGAGTGLFNPDASVVTTAQLLGQQLIGMISGALTFPFFIGCMTLLYFDRRVRTEAYDLEAAADALPAGH